MTLMSSTAKDAIREYVYLDSRRDPFDALYDLREAIETVTEEEVQRLRNLDVSWKVIGQRLGITRQTAVARYGSAAD